MQSVSFNAGMWLMNLTTYRSEEYKKLILDYWLPQNNEKNNLWTYGTQPLMLLAFYEKWFHLEPEWFASNLGWNAHQSDKIQKTVSRFFAFLCTFLFLCGDVCAKDGVFLWSTLWEGEKHLTAIGSESYQISIRTLKSSPIPHA